LFVVLIGVLAALVVGSASATARKTVALSVNITGAGTVRVGSYVVSCAGMACHQVVRVRLGSRVVIRTTPAACWKFTTWAGACRDSETTCSLQPLTGSDVGVSFVPPGVRANPYPVGTAVTLVGGWRVTINSDTINADEQVERGPRRVRIGGKRSAARRCSVHTRQPLGDLRRGWNERL
jgi:hypothetical protein